MASAEPSSKRSEIKVLKALTRNPMIIKLITRNMIVPRRIFEVVGAGGMEEGADSFDAESPEVESSRISGKHWVRIGTNIIFCDGDCDCCRRGRESVW